MCNRNNALTSFTDVFAEEFDYQSISQPLSISSIYSQSQPEVDNKTQTNNSEEQYCTERPAKHTGQYGEFRSVEEIDQKYRCIFSYPFFNLVQSRIIEDALYSDKSMVVCAPTGSGKTVVFEMAIAQLLMDVEDRKYTGDFKIIYMAPVKAVCTERLTEWYPKLTQLGLMCIEVTGDTDVDFAQLKPYKVIITTPEKWDILTRRWTDYRGLVEMVKLFLIDEVHILNDELRGPVLEAVVSRMKTVEGSAQSAHRIERLQKQYNNGENKLDNDLAVESCEPRIRFVAVSATVSNPEDVAEWLGTSNRPAVYHAFGDECRPVKLKKVVEGYPCPEGTSIFKFDYILNYKLWPIIQKYYNGKPTLIFCNTRKSVGLTAETLSKELTVTFHPEQRAKLNALASTIKNKKLQMLVANGVGCHHAGLLYEERMNIEKAFRNRELPILITTTTLAMGVNLPAHLVIIKNTQQYVNGAYQEYSITTILQMVGRAGRPQFDNEATAVIMTRSQDKPRYEALVGGSEPLQSYLHRRMTENLNSEAALGTVGDVAQCVQWLRSTFLYVRAAKDPRRYLGLPPSAPQQQISKKIEEMCVKAMNGLASAGLITMDEACCIESTEAGRLMSVFYLDFETMKKIMKIEGSETLEQLLRVVCESHELSDMHLRVDERRQLNLLNRNNAAATIRFPMKGKITTREMKLSCVIQAVLGCLPIPDPSLNQEAMKIVRIADRVCKCLVAYTTRPAIINQKPKAYSAVLNSIVLAKCLVAQLWENSPYLSKQLKGIGPTFSTLLATAGKVNFASLEESHPRDLERIINKGPPAGNVLHKQITLLPKYQLTMSPVDEKTVTVKLMLLNQHYLAENMNNLTAGDSHKSYIVIGDSENYLLMFNNFKDRDLISVYDGNIIYTITRQHRFEHKVFAHCISSKIVGLDVHCDYLFRSLDQVDIPAPSKNLQNFGITPKKSIKRKQTDIRDTLSETRKRKNDLDILSHKEKKKRDSDLIQKFNSLKESLGVITKEIKHDLQKALPLNPNFGQATSSGLTIKSLEDEFTHDVSNISENFSKQDCDINYIEDDDRQIEIILQDIESEINNASNKNKKICDRNVNRSTADISTINVFNPRSQITLDNNSHSMNKAKNCSSNRKSVNTKKTDNYEFMKLLEKNVSDEDETSPVQQSVGFSEAIKFNVQKYLQNAKNSISKTNKNMSLADIEFDNSTCDDDIQYKNMSDKIIGENITGTTITEVSSLNEDNKCCQSFNTLPDIIIESQSASSRNNVNEKRDYIENTETNPKTMSLSKSLPNPTILNVVEEKCPYIENNEINKSNQVVVLPDNKNPMEYEIHHNNTTCQDSTGYFDTNENCMVPENNDRHQNYNAKCTYSATKVDIWKQDFPQFTLKVIQKIELDVDIMGREQLELEYHNCNLPSQITNIKEKKSLIEPHKGDRTMKLENASSTTTVESTNNNTAHSETQEQTSQKDEVGKSTVKSILEKYAKVLRNKAVPSQISIQPSQSSTNSTQPTTKKRPFRITDIQNVSAALATTLVKEIGTVSQDKSEDQMQPNSSTYFNTEANGAPSTEFMQTQSCWRKVPEIQYDLPIELATPKDISETHEENSLDDTELFVEELNELDVKEIDNPTMDQVEQSMLDPKALLQFCNTDDEVLPPPPGFGDDSVYSPSPHNGYDNDFCNTSQLTLNTFDEDNDEYNYKVNSEIEDAMNAESSQIETWVLSPERELEDYYNRTDISATNIQDHQINTSRHFNISARSSKLNTFKLKPKSKYRKNNF